MIGHTPGPWRIAAPEEGTGCREPEVVGPRHVDEDDCEFVAVVCCGLPGTEANARLIADTPVLLDAVEAMWRFCDDLQDGADDATWEQREAGRLAGRLRDLLCRHGRLP